MSSNLLGVENLSFHRVKHTVLKNLNFSLEKNQGAIILGKSGTGKGLLLRIIAGLIPPSEGEVFFEDQKIFQMSYYELQNYRRKIGFTFEGKSGLLPNLNVWENITLPFRYFGEDCTTLRAIIQSYFKDFNLPLQYNFLELYPYQCTHLAYTLAQLLRGILLQPHLLILENPLSLLGPENARKLFEFITFLQMRLKFSFLLGTTFINFQLPSSLKIFSLNDQELTLITYKEALALSNETLNSQDGDLS